MYALPQTYLYEPLNLAREEIRLIVLEDVHGNDPDVIRLRLRNVSILEGEQYTALSYCWGDQSTTQRAIIDGCEGAIGLNLHAALVQLKSMDIKQVWVDAICINQRDKIEKAMQIPRMRLVYQSAVQTAAWLGEPPPATFAALAHLRTDTTSWKAKQWQDWLQDEANASALQWLSSQAYWNRVWVTQELVFSTHIILVCGSTNVEWSVLESFMNTIEHEPRKEKLDTKATGAATAAVVNLLEEAVERFLRIRALIRRGSHLPLLALLLDTVSLQSSEQRDKLYALLGLASDASLLVPVPSYNAEVLQICVDFTERLVAEEESLDPLFIFSHERFPDFPAWLPNWLAFDTIKPDYMFRTWHRLTQPGFILVITSSAGTYADRPAHITRGSRPDYRIGGSILVAQGSIIDKIDEFLKSSTGASLYGQSDTHSPPPQRGLKSTPPSPYRHRTHTTAAIRAALDMTQMEYNGTNAATYWTDHLYFQPPRTRTPESEHARSWLDDIAAFRVGNSTLGSRLRLRAFFNVFRDLRYIEHYQNDAKSLEIIAATLEHPDQIMRTERGFFGWCCPEARIGDQLCVLKGCKLPLVIRPAGNSKFEVIGTAWLHGIMDGPVTEKGYRNACWESIGWPPAWEPLQFV